MAAKFYGIAFGETRLGGCSDRIFDRQCTLIRCTVGNFLPILQEPMGVENTGEVLESRTDASSMQQCCRRYTHASVDQSLECEYFCRCTAKAFFYALILAYNNRLQYRFGVHPRLWSFIHFLQQEESLVLMRTMQIRSGNYRDKALPFSMVNEQAAKKTKQLKNLALLYAVGSIDLKQYLKSLSSFVGNVSGIKSKKKLNGDGTVTIETDFADDQ